MLPKSEIVCVGFLTFPGFPMACLTSMIEPLRVANEIAGQDYFSWRVISEDGRRVASSAQVIFEPDGVLARDLDLDFLFLLSSPTGQFEDEKAGQGTLRHLQRHGVILGGISGGVFPLARSGLASDHVSSVHWCYEAAFREEFPDLAASDDLIVLDRGLYSASGAAAAFDLALQMIEEKLGADISHEVACWFQHPTMRGKGVRQRVPSKVSVDNDFPDLVRNAIELFAAQMTDPIPVSKVAETLGVSPRQIERAFKKATGCNPTTYFRGMRMKAARQLVLYSNSSVAEVARAVGYMSPGPFIGYYKAEFSVTPSEDRSKMNAFRVQGTVSLPMI